MSGPYRIKAEIKKYIPQWQWKTVKYEIVVAIIKSFGLLFRTMLMMLAPLIFPAFVVTLILAGTDVAVLGLNLGVLVTTLIFFAAGVFSCTMIIVAIAIGAGKISCWIKDRYNDMKYYLRDNPDWKK